METSVMPEATIRPKGQITIPAEILQTWHVNPQDKINVTLVNGVVMLTPVKRTEKKRSIRAYAGVARGVWGNSADEIDAFVSKERDSWER